MVQTEAVYHPIRGEQAAARLATLIEAVDLSNHRSYRPNLDLRRTAVVVLAAAHYAQQPEIRSVFARLPAEFFDIRQLDLLTDLGWAAWYAGSRYQELLSQKQRRVVPKQLALRVADRKKRMVHVVRYHLREQPSVCRLLKEIGKGRGYAKDAAALTMLAGLYQAHQNELSRDTTWYREQDIREAEQDAAELMRYLGGGVPDASMEALDLVTRAFVLVQDVYGKVREAAGFAFGRNSAQVRNFPVLHTAVRRPAKARKAKSELGKDQKEPSEAIEPDRKAEEEAPEQASATRQDLYLPIAAPSRQRIPAPYLARLTRYFPATPTSSSPSALPARQEPPTAIFPSLLPLQFGIHNLGRSHHQLQPPSLHCLAVRHHADQNQRP